MNTNLPTISFKFTATDIINIINVKCTLDEKLKNLLPNSDEYHQCSKEISYSKYIIRTWTDKYYLTIQNTQVITYLMLDICLLKNY